MTKIAQSQPLEKYWNSILPQEFLSLFLCSRCGGPRIVSNIEKDYTPQVFPTDTHVPPGCDVAFDMGNCRLCGNVRWKGIGPMTENQSSEDRMLEAFREDLGEIDAIAQIILKSHILIEAQLFDILVLLVDEPEYLEKANLRFYQKANLLRATVFHEDGDEAWPLVLAFNKLRNTVAHGDANEERTVQIEVLRGMLMPIVTEETKEQVRQGSELEITTLAAAMAGGFLVDVENQVRREVGPEEAA